MWVKKSRITTTCFSMMALAPMLAQTKHSLMLLLLSKPSAQFKGQVLLLWASRKSLVPCKNVMETGSSMARNRVTSA